MIIVFVETTTNDHSVVADHSIDAERWHAMFVDLMARTAGRFARVEHARGRTEKPRGRQFGPSEAAPDQNGLDASVRRREGVSPAAVLRFGLTPYVWCVVCEADQVVVHGLLSRRRIPTFRILGVTSLSIIWCDNHRRRRHASIWFLGLGSRSGGPTDPRADLKRMGLDAWLNRAIRSDFGDGKHLRHLNDEELAGRVRIARRGRKWTARQRSWIDTGLVKLWDRRVRLVETELANRAK